MYVYETPGSAKTERNSMQVLTAHLRT